MVGIHELNKLKLGTCHDCRPGFVRKYGRSRDPDFVEIHRVKRVLASASAAEAMGKPWVCPRRSLKVKGGVLLTWPL